MPGISALVAAVSMIALPQDAAAQSRRLPADGRPVAPLTPPVTIDVGAEATGAPFDERRVVFVLNVDDMPQAMDCKMVRSIDPNFASKMPVVTPDPKLTFRTPIFPVPSCKR
jgi:hypothetical protein